MFSPYRSFRPFWIEKFFYNQSRRAGACLISAVVGACTWSRNTVSATGPATMYLYVNTKENQDPCSMLVRRPKAWIRGLADQSLHNQIIDEIYHWEPHNMWSLKLNVLLGEPKILGALIFWPLLRSYHR